MKSKKIPSPLEEITIDNGELPEGWEEAPLLELCELIRGVSYTKGEESHTSGKGFVPLLRANNIDRELKFDDIYYVPERFVKPKQYLQQGDALFAMSSGSKSVVGKAATVRQPFDGTFGAFCGVLRPSNRVDWKFFGYFFQTKYYRDRISEASAGVNINNLKREYFEAINFPLPPISEQQRIVARVEALLSHINAAREPLSRVPLIMKKFRQAVLAAACSGRLTEGWREENPDVEPALMLVEKILRQKREKNPKYNFEKVFNEELPEIPLHWGWIKWNDVVDWITYGFTKPMPHVSEGIPIITAKNIRHGKIDLKNIDYTTLDAFNSLSDKDRPKKGEILLIKDGATIGRSAIVNFDFPFCINQLVAVIRFHPIRPFNQYLQNVIQSKFTQDSIWEEAEGTAMPHISITKFSQLPLPLPPLAEQYEIVRRVGLLFERADAFDHEVAAAGRRCERLTQAVLGKAFRGELVNRN